ncbi:hypothetical protein [Methylobacterium nigriterrae]|uniref:hypothetical protein n=1 Tax=Methylobacterium nigriterrae TaxID=3127512 RepID=UPI003013D4C8
MSSNKSGMHANIRDCACSYVFELCECTSTNDGDPRGPSPKKLLGKRTDTWGKDLHKRQRQLDPDRIAALTPRGGLQAAEFEDRRLGYLSVDGATVSYTDASLGAVLLSTEFASGREAALQMTFYRSTYQDVKARRAAFRAVPV